MNTNKKTLEITGNPHLPLTVGMPAFIDGGRSAQDKLRPQN